MCHLTGIIVTLLQFFHGFYVFLPCHYITLRNEVSSLPLSSSFYHSNLYWMSFLPKVSWETPQKLLFSEQKMKKKDGGAEIWLMEIRNRICSYPTMFFHWHFNFTIHPRYSQCAAHIKKKKRQYMKTFFFSHDFVCMEWYLITLVRNPTVIIWFHVRLNSLVEPKEYCQFLHARQRILSAVVYLSMLSFSRDKGGVLRGLLGWVVFFVSSDIESGIDCILSKSADNKEVQWIL